MAHFAQLLDGNIVTQVIVVDNENLLDENGVEQESIGIAYCKSLFGEDTNWVQTSYNGSFRKNYAGMGYIYDTDRDAFIPPQPYASWTLNESTCIWEAPVEHPNDGHFYNWNEDNQQWDLADA